MAVNLKNRLTLGLSLGLMCWGLPYLVFSGWSRANRKLAMARLNAEEKITWTAAGIVQDRIARRQYANPDEAFADFRFERIRLAEGRFGS